MTLDKSRLSTQLGWHEVRSVYADIYSSDELEDPWHAHSGDEISRFLRSELLARQTRELRILDVGVGDHSYIPHARFLVSLDLTLEVLVATEVSVCADGRNLPFPADCFDIVVCMGSVVNYAPLPELLREFGRVLARGGSLLFDYERSITWEFIGLIPVDAEATLVPRIYKGVTHRLYVYSDRYVERSLAEGGFSPVRTQKFHLISPLIYRFTASYKWSAVFSGLDKWLSTVPLVAALAANRLMSCVKIEL